MPGAFYKHIADAIVINRGRLPRYAALTGGRSRWLSRFLIGFELGCIPFALYVDWRARPFNARGIAIGDDDFVSMEKIRPVETPPRRRGRTPEEGFSEVAAGLKEYRRAVAAANGAADFRGVAAASAHLLEQVEAHEARFDSHLAMLRHFVESIGLAGVNALRFAEASAGETVPLSRALIRIQALGLVSVLRFDRMAQPIHASGVGILLNDVPDIPFLERWRAPAAPAPARA